MHPKKFVQCQKGKFPSRHQLYRPKFYFISRSVFRIVWLMVASCSFNQGLAVTECVINLPGEIYHTGPKMCAGIWSLHLQEWCVCVTGWRHGPQRPRHRRLLRPRPQGRWHSHGNLHQELRVCRWLHRRKQKGMKLGKSTSSRCPSSHGLVVRAVACEARGPGFNSSSDQMVFSLLGYKEVGTKWIQAW